MSGEVNSGKEKCVEEPHQISKAKVRFIRLGVLVTIVLAALMGLWISGMDKPLALLISFLGGFLAMLCGMILAGIKYQDEIIHLTNKHTKELEGFNGRLSELEEGRAQDRREFGMTALVVTKTIADKVASRLIVRHVSNLRNAEQREAAIKEAASIVTEEIISFGENSKSR